MLTAIPIAAFGIGIFFGMFGAGGSAFATPVLALLGVPGALAVASPLPAMLPAAVTGARRYLKEGTLNLRIAKLAIVGGLPGTLIGALLSKQFSGKELLIASGVLLFVVGSRMLMPDPSGHSDRAIGRRSQPWLIVGAAFVVGLLTGLLANGGGFLLVPMFMLLLGLTAGEAAGTSMVTVGVLTIPSLLAHWELGHIDWKIAALFAVGLLPGSAVGSRLSSKVPKQAARKGFGVTLAVFAVWFLMKQA